MDIDHDAPAPRITGRGLFLPSDVLTNDDVGAVIDPRRLADFVGANSWCSERRAELSASGNGAAADAEEVNRRVYAEFVEGRVGIRTRHVVDRAAILARGAPSRRMLSSDMGAIAARAALEEAGVAPGDVDVVVCGTSSPDAICPSTAVILQGLVGAKRAFAFDVSAACSSFVFALEAARGMVRSGAARRALVVSAEYFTCNVDYADPESAYFFGDGAGAVVLEHPSLVAGRPGLDLVDCLCRSEASERITTAVGGTRVVTARHLGPEAAARARPGDPAYPWFHQDGPGVYRDVVPKTADLTREMLARHGLAPRDVGRFLFHQASAVMIAGIAKRIGVDASDARRVRGNLETCGNTSSAGLAIALAQQRDLAPGELVCLVVFGGGYTLGAALLRWGGGAA